MEEISKVTNHLGRYRLVTTLGQGGMGTIWLAVAGGLGEFRKLMVVKELRWDLTRNQRFVEMFLDEAKLVARLNHPNVVQTLEAGQEGERYFLAMEFLDGQPLSEVMQRATQDPQISLGVRLRILCGALAGLHYAHELRDYDGTELQIVHRDVSPQNIFVTYDGQVKMVDFGIAKAADAGSMTQPGVFKGKFAYASPEQIKGQPVDRRADIFAMGVLLWELVTLQRFAKGKPSQATIEARLSGAEPRLSQIEEDVEPLLSEICDRAMQVEPSARFATAEEFRVAVEQYLFVSGERVDTPALASIMQSSFARERSTMHRMIDSHLKEAEFSESLVRRLRPLTPTPVAEHDNPTTVADLSELVESSRSELTAGSVENTGSFSQSLRGRSRAAWVGLAVVVGIVAIAAYTMRGEQPPAAHDHDLATAPTPASPTSEPAAPPSLPPAVVAAQPPAAAAPPTQPAAPVATAAEPEARAAVVQPASPRSSTSGSSSGRRSSASRERVAATPGSMFGAVDLDAPVLPPEHDAAPSLNATNSAEPKPAASQEPVIGEDLRRLQRSERRKLDLEDPFQ